MQKNAITVIQRVPGKVILNVSRKHVTVQLIDESEDIIDSRQSDENGKVEFTHVREGKYLVRVRD